MIFLISIFLFQNNIHIVTEWITNDVSSTKIRYSVFNVGMRPINCIGGLGSVIFVLLKPRHEKECIYSF